MLPRFILFIGIISLSFSCGKEKSRECSGICTEEFRSITVEITDTQRNPVVLDSTSITDITNDRQLNLISDFENGFYTIFNDNFVSQYKNEEISLLFQGFQDEDLLVEQEYEVGVDCCHVYYISGALEIILD
ncbi:hypothetical protein LB467_06710 [Salegentibacter sp. JZCK2]|uniref:hypothetical protein n=1 Tax=Salegentibacter tibetensis TaxID=2873600 RepID=UPI001CCF0633|nr:hypothetical protein [Salegentibacter tibetensis]MBZ9729374.1 hypothetical protein [Salegentibacter tibetensis]